MNRLTSDKIKYKKPPVENFLSDYNNLLAELLVKNKDSLKFIASPTINRLEAQTHFFEKIQKYVQICSSLKENTIGELELTPEDSFMYRGLDKEFRGRVFKCRRVLTLRQYLKTKILARYIIFLLRWVNLLCRTLIFAFVLPCPKKRYQTIIRSYFDHRCKDNDGNLREEYFGPLILDLIKTQETLVVYKLLTPSRGELKNYLNLRLRSKFDSCLVESFLSPIAVIRLFFSYLSSRIKFRGQLIYMGRDIAFLLQQSLDSDYFSFGGLVTYIEYAAVEKILNLNPERILMPYENQAWEKVYPLLKARKSAISTRIIGFQHTGISFKLLNYFPPEQEKGLPFFPDTIITVGKITKKILEEKAYFPSKIIEGAALRHFKLAGNSHFDIKPYEKKINSGIVYAFSYDITRYKKIIRILIEVFGNSCILVYLKIHPDYDEESVIKDLGLELPSNFIPAQRVSWQEIYRSVDCVLYNDNSIGLEGIINGLKTFMLDEIIEPIYDSGRMFYFDEWETKLDMQKLHGLMRSIETKSFNKEFNILRVSEYINAYYNVYTADKYFNAYL